MNLDLFDEENPFGMKCFAFSSDIVILYHFTYKISVPSKSISRNTFSTSRISITSISLMAHVEPQNKVTQYSNTGVKL